MLRKFFYWNLLAIGLTYVLVASDFDWLYFESTRGALLFAVMFPAALLGFLVPVLLPIVLYVFGKTRNSPALKNLAFLLGEVAVLGWLVSSFYKIFTGRIQPEFLTTLSNVDISKDFNFGFFRNGIFWGWPSSHATVAFAMSSAFICG